MNANPTVPSQAAPAPASGLPGIFGDALGDAVHEILVAKRAEIIAAVNAKINIPILSEGTEAKLYGAVYDAITEVVGEVL